MMFEIRDTNRFHLSYEDNDKMLQDAQYRLRGVKILSAVINTGLVVTAIGAIVFASILSIAIAFLVFSISIFLLYALTLQKNSLETNIEVFKGVKFNLDFVRSWENI
jgi:hypothetical protein